MRSHAPDLRYQVQHLWAAADHSIKFKILQKFIFQLQRALPFPENFLNMVYFFPKLVWREWLWKIVRGAFLDGFHRGFRRVETCHQDDVDARVDFHDLLKYFHPLYSRHHPVQKNYFRMHTTDQVDAALRIGRGMNLYALVCQHETDQLKV